MTSKINLFEKLLALALPRQDVGKCLSAFFKVPPNYTFYHGVPNRSFNAERQAGNQQIDTNFLENSLSLLGIEPNDYRSAT